MGCTMTNNYRKY